MIRQAGTHLAADCSWQRLAAKRGAGVLRRCESLLGFGMGSVSISDLDVLVSQHQSMRCYKGLSEDRRV